MRNASAASLGGLALLALALHTQAPTGQDEASLAPRGLTARGLGKSPASGVQSAPPEKFILEGPWVATRPYFTSPALLPDQPDPTDDEVDEMLPQLVTPEGTPNVEVLRSILGMEKRDGVEPAVWSIIATLPDPLHTRLSLLLDEQLEAILRSLDEVGWSFAGQWMPWSDRAQASEGDLTKMHKQNALKRRQEEMPGVLIFHAGPPFPLQRTLFVFVVGETPTSGIRPAQFFAAAHMAETVSTDHEIGLLGPTFSGSFPSLAKIVNAWHKSGSNHRRIHQNVFSGNVANQPYAQAFGDATGLELHGGRFNAADYNTAVCSTLTELGVVPSLAAWLKEDNSGYSTAVSRKHDDRDDDQRKGCPLQTYVFPRDISHLRNAYQEATGKTGRDLYTDQSARVGLTLKDPSTGEDSVPMFSDVQTPLAQQANLDAITRDLRRQRARIVFVAASNSLDALFLARVLHRDCPDTRVLIDNPHVLFESAAADSGLSGTLFLSNYPMFADGENSLEWPGEHPNNNFQFPDTITQGLFNVTQLLIADLHAWPDENKKDKEKLELQGYRSPASGQRHPGIWLLVLTRAGFRPLNWIDVQMSSPAWFQPAPGDTNQATAPRALPPRKSWSVVTLALSAGVLFICLMFWIANIAGPEQFPGWLIMRGASEARIDALWGIALSLSALEWLLLLPALPALAQNWQPISLAMGLGVVAALLAVLAWIAPLLVVILYTRPPIGKWIADRSRIGGRWMAVAVRDQGGPRSPRPYLHTSVLAARALRKSIADLLRVSNHVCLARLYNLSAFALPLALYVTVLSTWATVCFGYGIRSFWFRYRALELFWGSSPLWPPALFCLLLLYFCCNQFRRHTRTQADRPRLMLVQQADGNGQGVSKFWTDFQALCDALNVGIEVQITNTMWWRVSSSAVFALAGLMLLWRPSTSIEAAPFNIAIWMALFVILFWLGVAFYDVVSIGSNLMGFLDTMELLPLHNVVRRVAREWPRRPIWAFRQTATRLRIRKQMVTALLQRTLLLEKTAAAHPQNEKAQTLALKARGEFDDMRTLAFGSGPQAANDAMLEKYQNYTSELANTLLWDDVLPFWRKSPYGEDAPDDSASIQDKDSQVARRSSEFVALQLCRFIVYAVEQLKHLAFCVMVSFLILMIFFTSYSPQGPRFISRALAGLFIIFGYGVVRVFVHMERNSILSWISRTTPGKLNGELWLQLAALGGLPLLGVIGHLFPEITGFVSQWIVPTFQGLH